MNNFELHEKAQELADTKSSYELARELIQLQSSKTYDLQVTSNVDYFDIKKGDKVNVVGFIQSSPDVNENTPKLDIFKVVLPNTIKIHYLFTYEVK